MIKSLSCKGFRSFATKQTLELAIPNGKRGSGVTGIRKCSEIGNRSTVKLETRIQ